MLGAIPFLRTMYHDVWQYNNGSLALGLSRLEGYFQRIRRNACLLFVGIRPSFGNMEVGERMDGI